MTDMDGVFSLDRNKVRLKRQLRVTLLPVSAVFAVLHMQEDLECLSVCPGKEDLQSGPASAQQCPLLAES